MGMIVLVRHGAAEGAVGRAVGRLDLSLSGLGREQAAALAAGLDRVAWAGLYASPLARARETLAPLAAACSLTPAILDNLAEVSLGDWEGLAWDEIRMLHPDAYAARGRDLAGYRPPGGESFADLAERAGAALDALAAGPLPVLAVTHAGVIRVLVARVLGLALNGLFRFTPAEGRCFLLERAPAGIRLLGMNLEPSGAAACLHEAGVQRESSPDACSFRAGIVEYPHEAE